MKKPLSDTHLESIARGTGAKSREFGDELHGKLIPEMVHDLNQKEHEMAADRLRDLLLKRDQELAASLGLQEDGHTPVHVDMQHGPVVDDERTPVVRGVIDDGRYPRTTKK